MGVLAKCAKAISLERCLAAGIVLCRFFAKQNALREMQHTPLK